MLLSLAMQTPEVPLPVPVALLSGRLEEKLAKAAAMGYDGVELITTDPASLDTASLRSLLRANSLRVSAIASGGMAFAAKLTLLHNDPAMAAVARRRLEQMIDLAADLGAQFVTIGSFRGRTVNGVVRSQQELADVLRRAGKRAGDCGVRLALEPLNRYEADLFHTAAQVLEFLGEVDSPAVGTLLDTYHLNIEECSWTEPYRQVMAAGKLFYAHLGDNNRLPPGQGLIDFRSILRTLHEIGYGGWLSAELFPKTDPDTAARQTADTMRKWLSEVQ
jgi:sugar phosphate isomerase/epimerase